MKVKQLTEGTAICSSFVATTKLFRRDASWFTRYAIRNLMFLKYPTTSDTMVDTKPLLSS